MFTLATAIDDWRAQLRATNRLKASQIDELESHLLDEVDALAALPLSKEEAFLIARHRLGNSEQLATEFSKNLTVGGATDSGHLLIQPTDDGHMYAGLSRRVMAGMFNLCIYVMTGLIVAWLSRLPVAVAIFSASFLAALFAAYLIGMTYCYGGTLGMLLADIRVCRVDGSALSLKQAFLRNLPSLFFLLLMLVSLAQDLNGWVIPGSPVVFLWMAIWALVAAWLVVSLVMLIRNKHSRNLHDHLADTIVVDESFAQTNIKGLVLAWQ